MIKMGINAEFAETQRTLRRKEKTKSTGKNACATGRRKYLTGESEYSR
jgi:hypothetical protein